MAAKFAAITTLTDAFCDEHLNAEYRALVHRAIGSLARKRPSPLLKGQDSVWAAAVIHALGRVNFLDDPAQQPHCKLGVVFEFFGVAANTGQNKSRAIQKMLGMGPLAPAWTLPSRLADNPVVWMLKVNGLIIDIRHAPIELQRLAYEQGMIPFIPAEHANEDP
jgi:hypothetical protein